MGIKGLVRFPHPPDERLTLQSIYGQIGPGERVALSKLSVQHFEKHNRQLKLAIDISIWNFQTQSGKGGQNPVLRTLYYRLLRLLSLAILPLFVFDGPNKPPFKRGKRTGHNAASLPDFLTKQLLKQFGFPFHTAPGEAEAECALLQQKGIVDAVLSEDVDTLMFGCGLTIRNWSSEGTKGNKSPTHVNLYQAEVTREKSGLDSDGMVLVALMSGGDYLPEGIPGCGVKIACEAARAGFGTELLKLARNDVDGRQGWRDWLEHELRTNEGGHFKTKHSTLLIPADFPSKDILGYYIRPVVSGTEKIARLSSEINWHKPINVQELRTFVAEAFEWLNLSGALKFVRGLAPALLVHQLQSRCSESTDGPEKTTNDEREGSQPIKAICGRRNHFATDGSAELRVAYIPREVVGLEFEHEEPDQYTGDVSSDSELARTEENDPSGAPASPKKTTVPSRYNPSEPEKIWILETWAKIGVPLLVETWEEEQRIPKQFATRKARERKQIAKSGMKYGALDGFVKLTKPGLPHVPAIGSEKEESDDLAPQTLTKRRKPKVKLDRSMSKLSSQVGTPVEIEKGQKKRALGIQGDRASGKLAALSKPTSISTPYAKPVDQSRHALMNPWTLSRRPSDTFDAELPTGARYSALGVYASGSKDDSNVIDHSSCDENPVNGFAQSEISPSRSRRPTTPLSNSILGGNITVRRKRKAKPLTKAFTAPCGDRQVIDLESSEDEFIAASLHHLDTMNVRSKELDATLKLPRSASIEGKEGRIESEARRLKSGTKTPPIPGSPASSVSLPSPSALISNIDKISRSQHTVAKPIFDLSSSAVHMSKPGEKVSLRESLEGAWRMVETLDKASRPARMFSGVGVVDLTSD